MMAQAPECNAPTIQTNYVVAIFVSKLVKGRRITFTNYHTPANWG